MVPNFYLRNIVEDYRHLENIENSSSNSKIIVEVVGSSGGIDPQLFYFLSVLGVGVLCLKFVTK